MKSFLLMTAILVSASAAFGQSLTGTIDSNNPNDVLLIAFTVSAPTSFHVQSWGYGGSAGAPGGKNAAGQVIASGGFDPYLTLFAGIGPAATFLASNDDGLCPPGTPTGVSCPDSTLHIGSLPAGSYMLAVSVFDNFSFAENLGTGTAGDLFIGLGNYYDPISNSLRTAQYAIDITASGLTVVATQETGVVTPPVFTKTLVPNSIPLGGISKLTFTIANTNLLIPLTGVGFNDLLPLGLVVATPSGLNGPSCSSPGGAAGTIGAVSGSNLIALAAATIPANASCTFSVNVLGRAPGLLTNTTDRVISTEGASGNSATAVIIVGDPLRSRYLSNLGSGDSVINITNSGANSTVAFPAQNGNLCVNVYAFSPDEQLVACCACNVTPNAVVSLSARNDLLPNTLTPGVPTSLSVKLVGSSTSGGNCNPSTVGAPANQLALGPGAWATTIHPLPVTAGTPATTFGVSETPFTTATLSPTELQRITSLCGFIQTNGSGFGICRSCRLGGLGAVAQ